MPKHKFGIDLKEAIEKIPKDANGYRNIGDLLVEIFSDAGFEIQLHQQGIMGTLVTVTDK